LLSEASGPRLGVIGWPVAHSLSPAIQNAALAAAGLKDWRYQLLPVPPELVRELIPSLPASGFRGINVTIPHKEDALAVSTAPTARASAIGAANTLLFEADGTITADNTDAPGLIGALPFSMAGRTAQVLGAGGTARAALWALVDAGAAEVRVWNRTASRAQQLCDELGGTVVERAEPADVIVNTTSVGLDGAGSLADLPLDGDQLSEFGCLVDFAYSAVGTALVRAARDRGLPTVGGLELLVAQGALAFELFTGRPASVEAMRTAIGI
jgi:shikimate dehydrogenase